MTTQRGVDTSRRGVRGGSRGVNDDLAALIAAVGRPTAKQNNAALLGAAVSIAESAKIREAQEARQAEAQAVLDFIGPITQDPLAEIRRLQALGPTPFEAQQAPPVEGFLPELLNLPGIRHAVQGLGVLQERVLEPAGSLLVGGIQDVFIPGEQELSRKMTEAAEAARARGEGAFGQIGASVEAGGEVDLPSGTVSLPFEIGLPSAVFGPGKTLQDIQVGVRGAAELMAGLPFDVGVGKLAGAGFRAARGKIRPPRLAPLPEKFVPEYFGFENIRPGSPQWIQYAKMHPSQAGQMATYSNRLRQGLDPASVRVKQTPLEAFRRSFDEKPPKRGAPTRETVGNASRRLQEELTDKYAGGNAATSRAMREWVKDFGEEMPEELQFELQASVLPGAYSAGATWARQAIGDARRALGSGIDERDLNSYLSLRHQQDILANHPDRLVPTGLKGPKEVDGLLRQMKEELGPEDFARVESSAAVIRDFYRTQLAKKVDAGLVSREEATLLNDKYPWYNRIAYIADKANLMEKGPAGPGNLGGGRVMSVTSNDLRALSELGTAAAQEAPLKTVMASAAHTEMLIARNRASRALIETLIHDPQSTVKRISGARPVATVDEKKVLRRPGGEIRGTVSYMKGGKRVLYEVPEWAEREAKGLAISQFGGWARAARMMNAPARALLVEYNPAFIATNFMRDMMSAWAADGIWPWETALAMRETLSGMVKGPNSALLKMVRAGGDVSGFWGRRPEEWAKDVSKAGNIALRSEAGWAQYFGKTVRRPWETVRDIGHATELAPRLAAFKRTLKSGSSEQKAAQTARRITLDFDRSGNAIRAANNFFLFLNPAFQGAMLPLRALRDWPRARVFIPGMFGAKVAEYMWNRQYEEYFDIPLFDRAGKFIIMLPSDEMNDRGTGFVPHYISLPGMHQFSALLSPFEWMMHQIDQRDPAAFSEFARAAIAQGNPLGPVGEFPVPTQALKYGVELNLNYDSFRDRPIVPDDLIGLPAADQFDEDTSQIAIRLGQEFNFSPKKIDYLLRVGVLRDVAQGADNVLRQSAGVDVQADAVVAALEELPEMYPPEDVAKYRRLILNHLDPDLRRRVEFAEKQTEPGIPVVSTIRDRFYRQFSGQLYQSGLAKAAGEAGVNEDYIRELQNNLGLLDDENYDQEVDLDHQLLMGAISGGQWASGYQELGKTYEIAMKALGLQYPRESALLTDRAARAAFYDDVNTIGGLIPDRRTKGQLLLSAYNSIPIPEETVVVTPTGAISLPDIGKWFDLRDEYLDSFSTEDRALLQSEREAGMTPARREYTQRREATRPYYEVHKSILQNHPERIALYEDFRRMASGGTARTIALANNAWLADVQRLESQWREGMRTLDPELDAFLFSFNDSIAHTLHPDNLGLVREMELRPHMRVLLENNPELFGNLVQ